MTKARRDAQRRRTARGLRQIDRMRRDDEAARWTALGHPRTECTGRRHPANGCPNPEVHYRVFGTA